MWHSNKHKEKNKKPCKDGGAKIGSSMWCALCGAKMWHSNKHKSLWCG